MAAFEIETDSAANWIAIHFLEKQSGMKMGTNSIFEPSTAWKSEMDQPEKCSVMTRLASIPLWHCEMIIWYLVTCMLVFKLQEVIRSTGAIRVS